MGMSISEDKDLILEGIKDTGLYYNEQLIDLELPQELLDSVTKETVAMYRIIPIERLPDGRLLLVTDTADSIKNISRISELLNKPIKLLITDSENIQLALNQFYDLANYRMKFNKANSSTDEIDITPLKRKVNDLLNFCIDKHASDLHLLPYSAGIFITLRINGFIEDYTSDWGFLESDANFVVNILKQMDKSNNADITNSKMPNSGHFTYFRQDTRVECRMETVPVGNALNGRQKVNIRFQSQTKTAKTLDNIYGPNDLKVIKQTLYKGGSGLFLNSGPVGTGKTTSLYAEIDYLWKLAEDRGHRLVVYCIENPIEYQDERFTQVEVRLAENEALSLTSQVALKSALRSDPDIILYGEIRDSSDADVAMRASQTGLKMFATIHAGDCIRTINRLLDLNVSRMSLLAELKIIICQRLIGTLCPKCSRPHTLTEEEMGILTPEELEMLSADGVTLRERGSVADRRNCDCQDGLIGRVAVPEYVVFTNDLRNALLHMDDFEKVPTILKKHGFRSMWDKGLGMVCAGQAELEDVIQKIGRD